MFDTELQRRAALCFWPKAIASDGTITVSDSMSIMGAYPFDVPGLPNTNTETVRFTFSICRLLEKVVEITLRYRK